jgi:hypothetical protein
MYRECCDSVKVNKASLYDACKEYIEWVDDYRKKELEKRIENYMLPRRGWFGIMCHPRAFNREEALKIMKLRPDFGPSEYERIHFRYEFPYEKAQELMKASLNSGVEAITISLDTYSYLFK